MIERARRITRILQNEYDGALFAKYRYGRIDILRKQFKYIPYDVDGSTLLAPVKDDWFVMSLTDNWSMDGRSVEWGIEPILARLRSIDLHKRDLADEVIRQKEKDLESKDRSLDNKLEAFWKDNRRLWAKNFERVNRSNLVKKDRRYVDDTKRKLKG